MPPRSAVFALPPEIRDELNARLIGNGFSGYVQLADWLDGQGYSIGKSALHRYGSDLEAEFSGAMADARRAAELGRALVGDDDGSGLRRATTVMAQETLLRILISLRKAEASVGEDGEGADPGALAKALSLVTRSLADLGRLGLADSKFAAEQVKAAVGEAAKRVESAAQARGLSAEDAAFWREQVLAGM